MERMETDQHALACWAADCAERVLAHFEQQHPDDARPRGAIEAARAWTRGEQTQTAARMMACAAHAAATEADNPASAAAARAASCAAGTAHTTSQAWHSADAALASVSAAHPADSDRVSSEEREGQRDTLPAHLHFLRDRTADPPNPGATGA